MLVLPWNAYHNNPPPLVSNSSSLQSSVTPSVLSRLNKRKRESDGDADTLRQDWRTNVPTTNVATETPTRPTSHYPAADLHSCVPAPVIQSYQQPSDGLPTPVLSPISNKMIFDIKPEPSQTLQHESGSTRLNNVRKVVAQQINLEILLKHDELRLIDQEMAKCQVALEQLRRCTEIPYPSNEMSLNVSQGTGPALRQKYAGAPLPSSPAPWGVVDGPYSRHYATWLLPDARFDGVQPEPSLAVMAANGKRPAKGRHGRPSIVEDMNLAGMSSRSQRAQTLQALPPGYAQPREKASGPLLLKRKSDGATVKLKCPDCGRLDFGSAQGFINHCRIGHSRTFASHDAAAEHCGEAVEYDSKGAIMGVEPAITPATTSVHPIVRSAHMLPKKPASVPNLAISLDGANDEASGEIPMCASTPFLSALLQKQENAIDLRKEVSDAKEKVTLAEPDVEMSDDDEGSTIFDESADGQVHPKIGGTRGMPTKAPSTSPFLTSRLPVSQGTHDEDFGHAMEPSPTSDSNQAPSLIDDDEEYEAQSPASTPASEVAEEDLQFHIRDDEMHHDDLATAPEFQHTCAQSQQPIGTAGRRPSAFRKEVDHREEKHVSFDGTGSHDEQVNGDRSKRRKITK